MKQYIRLLLLFCVFLFSFACKKDPFDSNSGSFTDKRDNHSYKWVKIGENENVGGKLKETGFTHWNSPNTGASDEVGFGARAGGLYTYQFWGFSDRFWGINDAAVFWTVSQIDSNNAMYRSL